MLLGNYSVLTKMPLRFRAGSTTSVEPQLRSNYNTSGPQRNVDYPEGATTALKLYAKPTGYNAGYTWMVPQVSGQLSAYDSLISSGTLSLTALAGGLNGIASLTGDGSLGNPTLLGVATLVASLTGAGNINNPTAQLLGQLVASISGAGTISNANLIALVNAVASLVGSGTISSAALDGISVVAAVANISGGGTLTNPILTAIANAQASLTGSGTISAATLIAGFPIAASISGGGSLAATVVGLGNVSAGLVGAGALTNTVAALGEMAADILSYSALTPEGIRDVVWNAVLTNYPTVGTAGYTLTLAGSGGVDYNALADAVWTRTVRLTTDTIPTTAQIAQATWEYAIEAGFSAEQMFRLFGAVLAGTVSGAGTSTETFVGVDGTTNRIIATVDNDGNRLNVIKDGN